jgi:hypothetical protein
LEFGDCEDAAVEADDGDFDGRTENEVCELVGQEDLFLVRQLLWRGLGFTYLPVVHYGLGIEGFDVGAIASNCTPCDSHYQYSETEGAYLHKHSSINMAIINTIDRILR